MADWSEDKGTGGVPGSQLTALMSLHPDSPLQKDYSGRTMAKYQKHAGKLHEGVMAYGITLPATSKDIAKGADALPVGEHRWYGVGGAPDSRDPAGARVPEKNYNLSKSQFSQNEALGHVLDTEAHNIDRAKKGMRPVYAGGWNETNADGSHSAVVDHSTVHTSEREAQHFTDQRGERAYFDAKNIVSRDSKGREVA